MIGMLFVEKQRFRLSLPTYFPKKQRGRKMLNFLSQTLKLLYTDYGRYMYVENKYAV